MGLAICNCCNEESSVDPINCKSVVRLLFARFVFRQKFANDLPFVFRLDTTEELLSQLDMASTLSY